jgi:hypothetical protein
VATVVEALMSQGVGSTPASVQCRRRSPHPDG